MGKLLGQTDSGELGFNPAAVQKAQKYGFKIGKYMRKLAPLRSHKRKEIRDKAKQLHSQFMSKQKELRQYIKKQSQLPKQEDDSRTRTSDNSGSSRTRTGGGSSRNGGDRLPRAQKLRRV